MQTFIRQYLMKVSLELLFGRELPCHRFDVGRFGVSSATTRAYDFNLITSDVNLLSDFTDEQRCWTAHQEPIHSLTF